MASRLPAMHFAPQVPFDVQGAAAVEERDRPRAGLTTVTTDYFTVLDVPILAGRDFVAADAGGSIVTLTGGTWPSWAATHTLLRVGQAYYYVASRTSNSVLRLDDVNVTVAGGTAYQLDMESCCVRVRNDQSVDHAYWGVKVSGYPNEIFWFERGGRLLAQHVAIAGGRATLLRIGTPIYGYSWYRIDGYDIDAGDEPYELVRMDFGGFSNCHVELSGAIASDTLPTAPIVPATCVP